MALDPAQHLQTEPAGAATADNHVYQFDEFRIDARKRQLSRAGEVVPLYSKAFDLLLVLVRNGGRDLSKDELLESVWPGQILEEANLSVSISVVRKALGEKAARPRYIVTIPGHGYRFVADLAELKQPDGLVIETETVSQIIIDQDTEAERLDVPEATPSAIASGTALAQSHDGIPATALLTSESKTSSRRLFLFGGVGLAVVVVGVIAAIYAGRKLQHDRIVAARFAQVKVAQVTTNGAVSNVALSPNGKLFAFTRMEDDRERVSLRLGQMNGDRDIELVPASDAPIRLMQFSQDGSTLYYTKQDYEQRGFILYKISVLGGPPLKLRDKMDMKFTLSPDETRVVFERDDVAGGTRSLIISDLNGLNEQALLTLPIDRRLTASVSWSPDGSTLALAATRDAGEKNLTVLLMPAKGGNLTPLTPASWRELTRLIWLRDGSGLLMIGASPDLQEGRQVWFVSYPAGVARRVTNEPTIYDLGLSVGSDPDSFLVVQQKQLMNLWLGPASAPTQAKQLTFTGPNTLFGSFTFDWLPNNRFVYASPKGQGFSIETMNFDGKEIKEITSADTGDAFPSATADGRFIVFQSARSGSDQVWRTDADGSHARQLTRCGENSLPHASPDGKWVVFVSTCEGREALWRTTIDGEQPTRLSDRLVDWPRVSPDSQWIAGAYKADSGKMQLAIFSIDGGAPVKLFDVVPKANFNFGIHWTSDGKAIAYRNWGPGLWRQSIEGGAPERVPGLPDGKIGCYGWSRDGKLFAFGRSYEFRDIVLIHNSN